ncbi:MAG: flagellar basal body L-ring protein FlgH [Candidatus Krumholzibacteriota bacterium]|nr:flagellar basal body L-ring protein FlgH [Candidatus Krumholzibacteriota bacterium]
MRKIIIIPYIILLLGFASPQAQQPLWGEGQGSLYSNLKAYRVGDVVTVIIQEQSTAISSAKTDTKVKAEAKSGPGSGTLDFVSLWGLTSENNYKGDAKTSRSGQLQAQITVRISEILGNGDYRVEGQREININGERERITLCGVIRPRDINSDNTILSTYVANAQIMYDGKGLIDSGHEPGILTKLINWFF